MPKTFALLALLGSILASAPAAACDCVRLIPNGPHFNSDLNRIANNYPIAAEGVLVRDGPYAWRFNTTREYRGPGKRSYSISLISDCTLAPQELNALIGKPIFVLLADGPGDQKGNYEISRCVNLLGPDIENALRARIPTGCKRPN